MCLYIEKDAVAAIAEEDIEVYKVLRYVPEGDKYVSPFQKHEYPLGANPHVIHSAEVKTYEMIIGVMRTNNEAYYDVFHPGLISITYTSSDDHYIRTHRVEEGLHTFTSVDSAREYAASDNISGDLRVVRCIIPKGAEYYKGTWPYTMTDYTLTTLESYASSQLIALEEIKE